MGNFLTMENLEKLYNSYSTPTVFTYLASLYIEEGKYEKAIDICTAGLEQHPDYPFAHYVLATAYYHTNNFSGAKRELEITLAYEDQFPEAWRLLGMINSNLGLNILTKESALRYYLTNSFSSEAAQKFFRDEYVDVIDTSDSVSFDLEEEAETPEPEPIEESAVNEDIDSIFKEAIPTTEQEEEEKGLDEFFRDSLKDINVEEDLVEKETPEEGEPEVESTENDGLAESAAPDAEPTPEQDEFTRAMDSFFSDYEEEKREQGQDIPDQSSETISPEGEEESLGDGHEEETTGEERIDQEQLQTAEEEDLPENPPDKESDNMMDYTAVVADYISENQDKEEMNDLPGSLYAEEESDESADSEEEEKGSNADFLEDEPDIFPEESEDKDMPSTLPGESEEDEGASNFGRPPILTSTLGEIYISQGRFEEAYSVFQKLLEKDPENDRYRRKIKDIQHLIEKHGKKLKKE